jgi:lysyl-tRNA synthetase class 2
MRRMAHFQTIRLIREFFSDRNFLETPTPPVVEAPGMEAHLSPYKVQGLNQGDKLYLHTSPEFMMKELLSEGYQDIYNIGYCFRDEPSSETHRFQFLMLEWYRSGSHYQIIKKDTLDLVEHVRSGLRKSNIEVKEKSDPIHKTVSQLFHEILDISILDFLETKKIKELISTQFSELTGDGFLESNWPWEDYFFLLFLNKIEPHFKKYDILVVDEFPAPLAALSTLKPTDPRVCERFEVYLNGVELCNCFNELTNLEEQKQRFEEEKLKRIELYNDEMPEPKILFNALEKGIPPSAGIALGVERLIMGLTNDKDVSPFFD